MTEDEKYQPKNETQPGDIAQRDFVAFSVTAGLAATAESAAAAGLDVVETNVITHSYSPIEAGGFSLQFLPSATICQRGLSRETPRTSPHLRRQTNPTSSDCALPVDSQPTGFSGNGQFVGNLALLKKTLRAVERPKSALSGPPGASLSLSPTWRARLVNSRSCGLHLDERRFSQTSVVGYWPAVNQRYGSLATVMTTGSITTAVHRELA